MPMVQTLTKNKRSVVRKVRRRTGPRQHKPEVSPFPEYIEQKDGLYRCLLCKGRTLERYMWLNRCGMYQHEKRGTRHKRSVKEWLEAKASDTERTQDEDESDEASILDPTDASEIAEEQLEPEDSVEMEESESEPILEEPGVPVLYYPTTSADEPVKQGIRVVFDNLQVVDHEPDFQQPLTTLEVRKDVAKWDRPSQGQYAIRGLEYPVINMGACVLECVYGSTKMNGYYTCIWCNLPDMPQRKYRRCKRTKKILQEKPMQVMETSPEPDYPGPPPYQLLYPSH
ncbi:unnamed protein product [Rhizoctonia solani]|uniref:Uncharacterized protein n=1 Tax=Rhizoctonia solani TaxID=456999 RepID=A0A8H3AJZ4_9AGAM|nr:unnamed protein product [Rhizoctonia solani]